MTNFVQKQDAFFRLSCETYFFELLCSFHSKCITWSKLLETRYKKQKKQKKIIYIYIHTRFDAKTSTCAIKVTQIMGALITSLGVRWNDSTGKEKPAVSRQRCYVNVSRLVNVSVCRETPLHPPRTRLFLSMARRAWRKHTLRVLYGKKEQHRNIKKKKKKRELRFIFCYIKA